MTMHSLTPLIMTVKKEVRSLAKFIFELLPKIMEDGNGKINPWCELTLNGKSEMLKSRGILCRN